MTPQWIEAFYSWYEQIDADCINSISDENALRELAANTNLSICDFCAGPCGDCPQKWSDDPYPCDPCPQDQFGITNCTNCPYQLFMRLYELQHNK